MDLKPVLSDERCRHQQFLPTEAAFGARWQICCKRRIRPRRQRQFEHTDGPVGDRRERTACDPSRIDERFSVQERKSYLEDRLLDLAGYFLRARFSHEARLVLGIFVQAFKALESFWALERGFGVTLAFNSGGNLIAGTGSIASVGGERSTPGSPTVVNV
jgi:hypothetical protein